jgi:Uncharacterized protein conserved in bacteria (DUF2252)
MQQDPTVVVRRYHGSVRADQRVSLSSIASSMANHGQRVVEGQRLMQAASDIFLG